MDWGNERYVRIYMRDTDDWLLMSWEARALFCFMVRNANATGRNVTKRGATGLAALVRMPDEVTARAVKELVDLGCVVEESDGFLIPNHYEAQNTPSSIALRSRVFRERQREATDRNAAQRDATSRNTAQRSDTPSKAKPSKKKSICVSSEAREFSQLVLAELNSLTGKSYSPDGKASLLAAEAIVKDGHSVENGLSVVRFKARKWGRDEKMREHLTPTTLLRLSNFRKYVVEAEGERVPHMAEDLLDRLRRENGGSLVE